jgi:tetratricopeptide (TPR) repeat protein
VVALSELHQQVRAAIEAGDLERPRQICEAILAERPDNLETILLLAEIELELGHHRMAIDGFDRVLQSDPECFLAYAGLGIAFEALHDTAAAAHWFSRAFDLNPINLEVRAERDRLLQTAYPGRPLPQELSEIATARSLLNAGLAEQSLIPFRRAMAQEPGRQEVRVGLAEALWALGLHGETIAACRMALMDVPRAVKIHALLASIAADEGDVAQARSMLTDVHAQDPEGRIAARFLLDTPAADAAYEVVDLRIDPNHLPTGDGDLATEFPHWVGWMRKGLWQVLRLLIPPGEEDAQSEAAAAVEPPPKASAEPPPKTTAEPPTARLQQRRPPPPVRTSGPLGKRIQPGAAESSEDDSPTRNPMVSEEVVRVPVVRPPRPRRRTPPPAPPPEPAAPDDDPRTEMLEISPAALEARQKQERGRSH